MNGVSLAAALVVIVLLVLVSSIAVRPAEYSRFELERRKRQGDKAVEESSRRADHLVDLLSFQRVVTSLLLVVSVILLVVTFGWLVGIILGVILALEYGAVARLPFLHTIAQRYYDKLEPRLVAFAVAYPKVCAILRTLTPDQGQTDIASKEELLDIVSRSVGVVSASEKALIEHGLTFGERRIADIMTPRSVIDTVKRNEMLGPLVLDDLHKTGHSRFPVIGKDIDHVVGILHLRSLLTLDTTKKHTAKVETAMEPQVFYVHEEQTLEHALNAFLKTHHHLFIVVNQYRETVGLITLEDVMEALLGRKIIDEFDAHDDLRAVAARNPRGNNQPDKSNDV